MGKIADAIRGSALPEQNRKKLLALDREFVEMEMEIQTLKAQNLNLQAKINPLERKINGLKNQIKQEPAREYTEAGGVLFKRTPRGGYSDIPYCPTCHSAMFHISGPYTCVNQACRQMAGFSKKDLAKIMSTLPK